LKVLVQVGSAGVSDALLGELEQTLLDHELVKIRVAADDRRERRRIIEALCRDSSSELVQTIGHTAVIFKERLDP
jgi:RNA-binding protein